MAMAMLTHNNVSERPVKKWLFTGGVAVSESGCLWEGGLFVNTFVFICCLSHSLEEEGSSEEEESSSPSPSS